MKKPLRYKVGQRLLVPFVISAVDDSDSAVTYFLQVDESSGQAPGFFDECCGWANEEDTTDMIEFCDPDIRKQKIAAKIAALQNELNEIK